jgi:hypothetical protein
VAWDGNDPVGLVVRGGPREVDDTLLYLVKDIAG